MQPPVDLPFTLVERGEEYLSTSRRLTVQAGRERGEKYLWRQPKAKLTSLSLLTLRAHNTDSRNFDKPNIAGLVW